MVDEGTPQSVLGDSSAPTPGWVDFHLGVPPAQLHSRFCQISISQAELAYGGTTKIKVNPTQVSEQMNHPVQ